MTRYIAFLRAINVGGHILKMEQLRALFEELGLKNVATFIASGNVIFESAVKKTEALEQKIERHLQQSLGYEVKTFLRSAEEVAAIAEYEPFPETAPSDTLHVALMAAPLSGEVLKKLPMFESEVDQFHSHGRELYWRCRVKVSESPLNWGKFERAMGAPGTMRNINTIRRLATKYGPSR